MEKKILTKKILDVVAGRLGLAVVHAGRLELASGDSMPIAERELCQGRRKDNLPSQNSKLKKIEKVKC